MALRPSKRQKRLQIPEVQESEEPKESGQPTSLRSAQARGVSHKEGRHTALSELKEKTPGRLPLKTDKGNAKKTSKKKQTSKGILSFFNAITQSQNASPSQSGAVHQEESDVIEDERADVYSALSKDSQLRATSIEVRPSIKRHLKSSNDHDVFGTRFAPRPSFAFRDGNAIESSGFKETRSLSWSDAYPPKNVSELALHPKKISSIRTWLQEAINGTGDKSLLVLRGPAGCGKSAAIRTIADSMHARLVEWENPIGYDYGSEGFVSLAVQFEEFLSRSSRYVPLDMTVLNTFQSRSSTQPKGFGQESGFLLIEDLPNTFAWNSSALLKFRSSLLRYIANTKGYSQRIQRGSSNAANASIPLIILVTETPGTASKVASDSLTVHKLLGSDVLHHPATTIIEINPVAPTFMAKALHCLLRKQKSQFGKVWRPNAELIKRISQFGDIRSATNALEYAYVSQDDRRDQLRLENPTRLFGGDAFEKPTYSMVQREPVLDMFHAVGKVMYNKRTYEHGARSPTDQHQQPPEHLMQHSRPRKSDVSSEELMSSVGTDVETFVAALHENYVPSCTGERFIDTLNDCIENLSVADILSPYPGYSTNRSITQFRKQSGNENADRLKQDDFAFHTAVSGLLFSLPYPVERGKFSRKDSPRIRDPFKMVYPISLRLWRQISDTEAIIGSWYHIITLGGQSYGGAHERGMVGHQESSNREPEDDRNERPLVAQWIRAPCKAVDRSEMILNYLPYLCRIRLRSIALAALQDLHNLTVFSTSGASDIDSHDNGEGSGLDLAPRHTEEALAAYEDASLARRSVDESYARHLPGITVSTHEKLVLSDDDIIDD